MRMSSDLTDVVTITMYRSTQITAVHTFMQLL
jgi:hypothetical protein